MTTAHRLLLLLTLALVVAACGGDEAEPLADDATTPAVTAEPTATPTPEPEPTAEPDADPTPEPEPEATEAPDDEVAAGGGDGTAPGDGDIEPVGSFGGDTVQTSDFPDLGGEIAQLVDVRVAAQDGFDRVVLEFSGGDIPTYRLSYLDPPIQQDGSGEDIAVAGTAFLELRLTPASGVDLSGESFVETYTGPDRVPGSGTASVTEVVRTGDFEANLAWVIGMDGRAPFAFAWLSSPLRLVVDVAAG